jgi:hypothetical protein
MALLGIIAERIFAQETIGHAHSDMGTGCEFGQVSAIGVRELEHHNILGDLLPRCDAQAQGRAIESCV